MVLAQYYNFVRFGHEGYRYIMETMQANARMLAQRIRDIGEFELVGAEAQDHEHSRRASRGHHVGVHVRGLAQGGGDLLQVVDQGQGERPAKTAAGVLPHGQWRTPGPVLLGRFETLHRGAKPTLLRRLGEGRVLVVALATRWQFGAWR